VPFAPKSFFFGQFPHDYFPIFSTDTFKGIVHVYVPKTTTKWSLQALIRSPVWDNNNFGNDVSVDDEQMVVAANAYRKSIFSFSLLSFTFLTSSIPLPIFSFCRTIRWHCVCVQTEPHPPVLAVGGHHHVSPGDQRHPREASLPGIWVPR